VRIHKITIIGGCGRNGVKEPLTQLDLQMGQVVSIVGPTGSGKTALINDIGLFADGSTPTQRRILINDAPPLPEFMADPSKNPIALITQHTSFLSDMPVDTFLGLHAKIRKVGESKTIVTETLDFANQLTGEAINVKSAMTELSGGQSRALLIADAVVIGNSPIILLDEIENAGIDRSRALALLHKYEKIFVFVTHDLHIALLSDFRIILKNGAMQNIVKTTNGEKRIAENLKRFDDVLINFRNRIRMGEQLDEKEVQACLSAIEY